MTYLSVSHVTKKFGGLVALDDCSFTIEPGRISCVVGPNGATAVRQGQSARNADGSASHSSAMAAQGDLARAVIPGLAWQNRAGNVLGLYLHGLFEDAAALQALFGMPGNAPVRTLDAVFDGLADALQAHFAPGVLQSLIHP